MPAPVASRHMDLPASALRMDLQAWKLNTADRMVTKAFPAHTATGMGCSVHNLVNLLTAHTAAKMDCFAHTACSRAARKTVKKGCSVHMASWVAAHTAAKMDCSAHRRAESRPSVLADMGAESRPVSGVAAHKLLAAEAAAHRVASLLAVLVDMEAESLLVAEAAAPAAEVVRKAAIRRIAASGHMT